MVKKKSDPKYVFEKARPTPKAKPNKSPSGKTNSVKDVLPTRDGIYKLAKKGTATPIKKAAPKSTAKKVKRPSNRKVQFSSRPKAEKAMRKNVKAKQKGRRGKSRFNR